MNIITFTVGMGHVHCDSVQLSQLIIICRTQLVHAHDDHVCAIPRKIPNSWEYSFAHLNGVLFIEGLFKWDGGHRNIYLNISEETILGRHGLDFNRFAGVYIRNKAQNSWFSPRSSGRCNILKIPDCPLYTLESKLAFYHTTSPLYQFLKNSSHHIPFWKVLNCEILSDIFNHNFSIASLPDKLLHEILNP